MKDRYLFRGKIEKGEFAGEWVEGQLIDTHEYGLCIYAHSVTVHSDPEYGMSVHEYDPATIGQCTGLKDDNGDLIYEDDILLLTATDEEDKKAIVRFGNPNSVYEWGWALDFIGETKPNWFNPAIGLWVDTELPTMGCEIIGNIHDNKELLNA